MQRVSTLPDRVMLVAAIFSRHPNALEWARQHLAASFGPIALAETPYEFTQTTYYDNEMGPGLRKQLVAFARRILPDELAPIKRATIAMERAAAALGTWPEPRPVNIDPGILTAAKLQLATTKDKAHRVYVRDGIFVEPTLRYLDGHYEPWPWTYADYRLPEVGAFLAEARTWLLRQKE